MIKRYEHIIIPEQFHDSLKFSPRINGGGSKPLPERNRTEHATKLQDLFNKACSENEQIKSDMRAVARPARTGTYLEFSGAPTFELVTKSLEDQKAGIRLLNIRTVISEDNNEQTFATVYIPHGKEGKFASKLNRYATENTAYGKPKNDKLFRSIESINIALLKSLWTDNVNDFPSEQLDWYEVWIRINDSDNIENEHGRFVDTLNKLHIRYKEDSILTFPERSVFLVNANLDTLTQLFQGSDQLAEIRAARALAGFIFEEKKYHQQEWVEDIRNRVVVNTESKSTVCILDTGVNNGHPLLADIIDDSHCATSVGGTTADKENHGTLMCGAVLYGDLLPHLSNNNSIQITHRISSVKLKPYNKENPKESWGALTAQAISISEVISPNTNICYCMAMTAEECENGKPSSWSGEIDSIIYNSGRQGRLFLISAGNIEEKDSDFIKQYPNGNQLCKIMNPAQSWNCMTIGAYTEKIAINNPNLGNRVAPAGGISPFSRTSVLWDKSSLIKPEVVFEGGNLIKTNDIDFPFSCDDDLGIMTTAGNYMHKGYFDIINATSAATALASNFAAKLQDKYPDLWAESIRGLIVHSAKWTPCMEEQFPVSNRKDMEIRLRCCGYGVPSEERALYSYGNGLTYIAQETIQPFIKERGKSNVKINEMHFFELPWPKEILEQLAETEVAMKITLSYFIEPAPGEIGWKDKYRYASCGLRFDLNNENEDERAFKLRINKAIEAEENEERGKNDSSRWIIGTDNRNKGSIHSDEIRLSGAQLATCNMIAVYPIGGWWKTRTNMKRYNSKLRYSLIVSLDTQPENIDMYNVVKTQIDAIINIPVEVNIQIDK